MRIKNYPYHFQGDFIIEVLFPNFKTDYFIRKKVRLFWFKQNAWFATKTI